MDFALLLSKLLPLLVLPVGATCTLLVVALILIVIGAHKLAFVAVLAGLSWLAFAATPMCAKWLGRPLEAMYAPLPSDGAPLADAIVVLGGGMNLPLAPRLTAEVNAAGDRVIEAARLYHAGRAPIVLASGGNVFAEPGFAGEAVYAAELLAMLGVPPDSIVVEENSRSTYENAVESGQYLRKHGLRRILLVTSAFHMPRALAVFDSAGIETIPVPTDYIFVDSVRPASLKYTPNADTLAETTVVLREYIGFFVYRWRGWISDRFGFRPGASKSVLHSDQSRSS